MSGPISSSLGGGPWSGLSSSDSDSKRTHPVDSELCRVDRLSSELALGLSAGGKDLSCHRREVGVGLRVRDRLWLGPGWGELWRGSVGLDVSLSTRRRLGWGSMSGS